MPEDELLLRMIEAEQHAPQQHVFARIGLGINAHAGARSPLLELCS